MDAKLNPYESRVKLADQALGRLQTDVRADLDEVEGGIRWWRGQTDWRRLALISSYLQDSIGGVSDALFNASLSAQIHREAHHADDFWLGSTWRALGRGNPRATAQDFLAAVRRGRGERQRDRTISVAGEHCCYHLAQALDRLAAVVVAIGAVKIALLDVGWPALTKLGNPVKHRQPSKHLEELARPGRAVQDDLISAALDYERHGPTDWLPWLLRHRNSEAHRAPKTAPRIMRSGKSARGLVRAFYRQPGWDDLESLASGADLDGPGSIWLPSESEAVLEGLVDSTVAHTTALCTVLLATWTTRRVDPTLLFQPPQQWPEVMAQPKLQFPGYGPPALTVRGGAIYVSPSLGQQWRAARVMDGSRTTWQS